jgi:hypothetical protein
MWNDTENKEAFKKIEEQRKQMEVKSWHQYNNYKSI